LRVCVCVCKASRATYVTQAARMKDRGECVLTRMIDSPSAMCAY